MPGVEEEVRAFIGARCLAPDRMPCKAQLVAAGAYTLHSCTSMPGIPEQLASACQPDAVALPHAFHQRCLSRPTAPL